MQLAQVVPVVHVWQPKRQAKQVDEEEQQPVAQLVHIVPEQPVAHVVHVFGALQATQFKGQQADDISVWVAAHSEHAEAVHFMHGATQIVQVEPDLQYPSEQVVQDAGLEDVQTSQLEEQQFADLRKQPVVQAVQVVASVHVPQPVSHAVQVAGVLLFRK